MDRPHTTKPALDAEQIDRYRFLFENSPDPLLIIAGGRFTDCNLAAVRMLGYNDKSEVINLHPHEISPEYQPDGRLSVDKADEMLSRLVDEPYQCFEWTHVRSDGTLFPVEVALILLPGENGPVLHCSWRDISARKRLEKELRHSQKMEAIGKLAGGIAHDINNQLVPIIGYADMLAERLKDDDTTCEWAGEINRAARMAAVVIRKLLAISRKDQGEMVTLELGETVSSLLGMLSKLIGDDIRIDFKPPPKPLWVRVGAGDIEQILLNLASNSRDALPQGGVITVALAHVIGPGGQQAHLHFADNGAGMDDDTLANVFEPFFTTKELGAGTGLGLSTVYDLVTAVGGSIEATSVAGGGTTFDVHLPVYEEDTDAEAEADMKRVQPPTPSRLRGRILVVEDNEVVSRFAKRALELRGFSVIVADDAAEALDCVSRDDPDLILSDVIMPGFSGPQMIEKLEASGVSVPVVFMSGYTDDRLATIGLDMSAVTLIRKPFSEAGLVEAIEDALSARSSSQ